ncbi:MAG: hypothetical protein PHH26_06680, partial [Candidatus Thermoplasmatota archaeon]|nr:hypothetical protein [Candidatus Thermoplasmatota archaeon]
MKALTVFAVACILVSAFFTGCIGEEKKEATASKTTLEQNQQTNTTQGAPANQTVAEEPKGPRCPDTMVTGKDATDKTETMAHWKFEEQANGYFQYGPVPAPPTMTYQVFEYKLDVTDDAQAIECLVDWESGNMDLDLYLMKGSKAVCSSGHVMMNDPTSKLPFSSPGTTWEYINASRGEGKKNLKESGEYTLRIEVFNNWEPGAISGGTTPFTVDIWAYGEIPSAWHPHQG